MTRKHWVRRMPWQLAAAGAVAGAVFSVIALYSANPAFAECRTLKDCAQSSTGRGSTGNNAGTDNSKGSQSSNSWFSSNQAQQPAQTFQLPTKGAQNNAGQGATQSSFQQWQGNNNPPPPPANNPWQGWQSTAVQQTNNTPPAPTVNQGVQQFVQQLTNQWQQPQPDPQPAAPQPKGKKVPTFVAPVTPPDPPAVIVPQIVVDPPAPVPSPVVTKLDTTTHKHSNNPVLNNILNPTINSPVINNVANVAPPVVVDPPAPVVKQQSITKPPKFTPPVVNSFAPPVQPVIPDFTGPVQQNAVAPQFFNNPVVGPNALNNFDPWWWIHHHPRQNPVTPPPPPPPPPPVVYHPPVFHRTVLSCLSVGYNQGYPYNAYVNYAYGNNLGYPVYGNQGMPFGYNPYLYNQYQYGQSPFGSVYGVNYNNYPLNSYPNGYNGYQNYNERVYTPYGIEIIHHVFVACAPPVQQVIVVQAPVVTPQPVVPSYLYQTVSAATAPAPQPQVYAPVYQQQGYISPPRTGEAGLFGIEKSSTPWLPDFVLLGLISVFSIGLMARVRQR